MWLRSASPELADDRLTDYWGARGEGDCYKGYLLDSRPVFSTNRAAVPFKWRQDTLLTCSLHGPYDSFQVATQTIAALVAAPRPHAQFQ
jgi:hypothetical protein